MQTVVCVGWWLVSPPPLLVGFWNVSVGCALHYRPAQAVEAASHVLVTPQPHKGRAVLLPLQRGEPDTATETFVPPKHIDPSHPFCSLGAGLRCIELIGLLPFYAMETRHSPNVRCWLVKSHQGFRLHFFSRTYRSLRDDHYQTFTPLEELGWIFVTLFFLGFLFVIVIVSP